MKKIGIIGGGQLGKMMILDGKRLDSQFYVLDPTMYCPCHGISDLHMVAGFDDVESIRRMAVMTDVLTYEFEHISVEALREVEKAGIPVYPSSHTLSLIQNKFVQKQWLQSHGIPVPEFVRADSPEAIRAAGRKFGYPLMLKSCTGGYDGKGNYLVEKEADAAAGFLALGGGKLPLMAEKNVPFTMEISVLACRGIAGWKAVYPVAENHHVNSILDETIVPARISAWLIILAAFLQEHFGKKNGSFSYSAKEVARIFKRDRFNHKSPNSAQTESAVAGALGVELAGDAVYFGKLVSKPFIGDKKRQIEPEDIGRANNLMYTAFIAGGIICLVILGIIQLIL